MTGPALDDRPWPGRLDVEAVDEHGRAVRAAIPDERPLRIELDRHLLATLTTLGTAPAHLALGWLRGRGLVPGPDALAEVRVDRDTGTVRITSRTAPGSAPGAAGRPAAPSPSGGSSSSADPFATAFTDPLAGFDHRPGGSHARLSEAVLHALLERLARLPRDEPGAGAVHACALCSNAGASRGDTLYAVEDVGPHNALDAASGWMWLAAAPDAAEVVLLTSAPLTEDVVVRCARMGIPFLLSRADITRGGREAALRAGLTTIGRCRGRHHLVFTGGERLVRQPVTALA